MALQFLRPDLHWRRAPLSFYLIGAFGTVHKAAYVALAAAVAALGAGWWAATGGIAGRASAGVFVAGAVAIVVTAVADTSLRRPYTGENILHAIAAPLAFLCVTSAILMQSWQLRRCPAWQPTAGLLLALAVLCMTALWGHALWRDAPRGLSQKVAIIATTPAHRPPPRDGRAPITGPAATKP
ncbi:MAG: DUF998 domain-containing protein [Pseudomonadota bacterium]|nr:DUF998 domain-containing protein [Pseudomonadota bacterium]